MHKESQMFSRFLRLEIKSFFRSPQFASGLAMKIGMFILFGYMAFIFFGGAFGLYFGAKSEHQNPINLFCRFFLLYWMADLVLKYFMQQLPTNNIKPFLAMKISKNKIVSYTLVKIAASFFTWAAWLFLLPFTVLLLWDNSFSNLSVLSLMLSVVLLLLVNSLLNILINKSNILLFSLFGLVVAIGGLQYFSVIDLFGISDQLFSAFYQQPYWVTVPLIVFFVLGYFTFQFIKTNLYLDKGLEMKVGIGKTESIAFLNRFGVMGTFINNDIRLIKRSKAARAAALGGVLFLFYGLLFFSQGYHNSFMQVFLGIFVTGGFNMMFGQRVPAWDSSYYPLMMTQNVPYKEYLKAKWSLFVIVTFISMIVAMGYAVVSWEFYFTIFAAGLYNLGVNSYLTLLGGAYNKQPIDLNVASKGFTSGQNNFNIKLLIILIPQLLLPMAVFALMKFFAGMIAAVVSLGVLGLVGFFVRDKIFDQIVKVYKTQKYSTLSAFKKID